MCALTPLPIRFWSKVDRSGGMFACWPWLGGLSMKRCGTRRGVIRYGLHREGTRRMLLAHRVALWLQDDPDAQDIALYNRDGLEACHDCNNRLCCNPHHLYWGTPIDNRADRYVSVRERVAAMAAEFADEVPF